MGAQHSGDMTVRAVPPRVDHLIYVAADLRRGMEEIEDLLGVRPVAGGRHPQYGTCNALLALGPETYLEVIAPDPGLPPPPRGVLFAGACSGESRLATWVLNAEPIEEAVSGARSIGLGEICDGSREQADGTVLAWRLTDPYAMPYDGAVPFLISWGRTPHPATVAPAGGTLVGLRVEHPEPAGVSRALEVLGVAMEVSNEREFRLIATIETTNAVIEL